MLVQCVYGTDSYYKVSCLNIMLVDVTNRKVDMQSTYLFCSNLLNSEILSEPRRKILEKRKREAKGFIDEFDKIIVDLKKCIEKERLNNVNN